MKIQELLASEETIDLVDDKEKGLGRVKVRTFSSHFRHIFVTFSSHFVTFSSHFVASWSDFVAV